MINVVLNGRIYDEDDDICMSLYVCLYVCEEGDSSWRRLRRKYYPELSGSGGAYQNIRIFGPV